MRKRLGDVGGGGAGGRLREGRSLREGRPMLDFVQLRERKMRKPLSRVDFIQRGAWNSGKNAEKASPGWTKSNEAAKFREKADFGWTKSNQASPDLATSRSRPHVVYLPPPRAGGCARREKFQMPNRRPWLPLALYTPRPRRSPRAGYGQRAPKILQPLTPISTGRKTRKWPSRPRP